MDFSRDERVRLVTVTAEREVTIDTGLRRWSVGRVATVDVVIPVFNEERALPGVHVLRPFLKDQFPFAWTITVVDNASTDGVLQVAKQLAESDDRVRVLHLDRPGAQSRAAYRGHGLLLAVCQGKAEFTGVVDHDVHARRDPDLSRQSEGHRGGRGGT